MGGRDGGRFQGALSYAVLTALGLIVLFPFYWMTVTSFKGEDQMRSLVVVRDRARRDHADHGGGGAAR